MGRDFEAYVRVFVSLRVSSRLDYCMLDVAVFQRGRESSCGHMIPTAAVSVHFIYAWSY